MPAERHGPTSHVYFSQRLRLHYVDWGNPAAPPMLLVHGGRDHCRNWDWVAQRFSDRYHVIAPDLRGHGDSQWMLGGSYNIPEYVYDIAQLVHQTKLAPLTVIGHSLGGSISLRYAGIYPEQVTKLVAIEGLGPSPKALIERKRKAVHQRLDEWMQNMRKMSGRSPRRYPTVEAAFKRMEEENPHLTSEQAYHLTVHGVNQNEDGTFSWKFDNYVRAFPPSFFDEEEAAALWSRINVPTLLIRGSDSWASDPLLDGRAAHFDNAKVVNIDNAGHWVHHDQLDEFMAIVENFLAD